MYRRVSASKRSKSDGFDSSRCESFSSSEPVAMRGVGDQLVVDVAVAEPLRQLLPTSGPPAPISWDIVMMDMALTPSDTWP